MDARVRKRISIPRLWRYTLVCFPKTIIQLMKWVIIWEVGGGRERAVPAKREEELT